MTSPLPLLEPEVDVGYVVSLWGEGQPMSHVPFAHKGVTRCRGGLVLPSSWQNGKGRVRQKNSNIPQGNYCSRGKKIT